MSNIDFMKVFDAVAASLKAAAHISVEALDLNRYSATFIKPDASEMIFTADLTEYDITLSTPKHNMPVNEYRKFVPALEYNLEQKFFKNIELESADSAIEYKIKISF